jgi:hypothetical protein
VNIDGSIAAIIPSTNSSVIDYSIATMERSNKKTVNESGLPERGVMQRSYVQSTAAFSEVGSSSLRLRGFVTDDTFNTSPVLQGPTAGSFEDKQMQQADFCTDNLRRSEFENGCRSFWLAYVMMETGEPIGDKRPTHSPLTSTRCTSFLQPNQPEAVPAVLS